MIADRLCVLARKSWRKAHASFTLHIDDSASILSRPPARLLRAAVRSGLGACRRRARRSDAERTAFQAGAALGAARRARPPAGAGWAGAWRQRLALRCAAASMRLAGRAEDEAALRDAWHLRPAGADPGPAGAMLRRLAPAGRCSRLSSTSDRLEKIVDQLGLHWDGRSVSPTLCTEIEKLAAIAAAGAVRRRGDRRSRRRHAPRLRAFCLVARRPGAGAKPALAAAAAAADGSGLWSGFSRAGRRQAHPTRRKEF